MILVLVSAFFIVLGVLSLRPTRWAYVTFVVLGMLFFPASVGFQFHPRPCECAFSIPLAIFAITKYGHIWRFAFFFLMTAAQVRGRRVSTQFLIALGAVMAMGIYVELAEGITGSGNCRLRDLVSDLAGAVLGAVMLMLWMLVRRKRASSNAGGI
jgi:4-amino-4-deoxy-L-arabinose transferase-like glycosyltransferase